MRFIIVPALSLVLAIGAWAPLARGNGLGASSVGDIDIFIHVDQMAPLLGSAHFDEGPAAGPIPADTYAAQGMTFHTGPLAQILPGVTTPGTALLPSYSLPVADEFPLPIGGGGVQQGRLARGGAVVTFSAPVTQIGLVASSKADHYITIWDTQGQMIAEMMWTPTTASSFIGIDTLGRPIGMAALGNDNLYSDSGVPYTPASGPAIATDSWMWSLGFVCAGDEDCDDHSICTGAETCQDGYCQDGTSLDCESDDACLVDICDAVSGCSHQPISNCCHSDADCHQSGTSCKSHVCVLDEHASTTDITTTTTTSDSSTAPVDESTSQFSSSGTTAPEPDTTTEHTTTAEPTTSLPTTPDATSEPTTTTAPAPGTSFTGDPGESAADGGCTCAAHPRPTAPLAALALALLLRRRRAARAR